MQFGIPSHSTSPAPSNARAAEVDAAELRSVLRMCGLPPAARRPITYLPKTDWKEWQSEIFFPLLLPSFLKAIEAARREQSRDLAQMDRALAASLPSDLAVSSSLAGRPLIEQLRPARGIPWVKRFEKSVFETGRGGQFAICYALACAFFNVGTWNAILALLCEEYSAASGISAADLPLETREIALLLEIDKLRTNVGQLESALARFQVA